MDHDHRASGGQGAVGDLELELALGEDAGVLAVEVLGGGSRESAGGDDQHAVIDGLLSAIGGNGGPILAGPAVERGELGGGVDLDLRVGLHAVDQVLERRLRVEGSRTQEGRQAGSGYGATGRRAGGSRSRRWTGMSS